VIAELVALGVDPDEARLRLAALSDEEIERIAGKLDALPAGEGFLETLAIVIGSIVLVLIITDIVGITNVFTFIR
jgi:hypothetical protein